MNYPSNNLDIVFLLQKYIENKCNKNELHFLFSWLNSADDLEEFDFVSQSLWNKLNRDDYAPDEESYAKLNKEVDLLLQKINTKKSVQKKNLFSYRKYILRIASVFLLLISIYSVYFFMSDSVSKGNNITYTEINALRGETKEYTLSDGTKIILNSDSKLRIPSDYNKENRQVEMFGEGFFDVVTNHSKPFIINSGDAQLKVLGTSFNVKAYPEDQSFDVTVSTGKVLVSIQKIDLQLRVMPMEHLAIDLSTGGVSKDSILENNYIKWMDGFLSFEKEPLIDVIKAINRKYNRNVILNCKDCNPIISGTHDNKSIEAVIEAICFTTGLKFRKEANNIILYD